MQNHVTVETSLEQQKQGVELFGKVFKSYNQPLSTSKVWYKVSIFKWSLPGLKLVFLQDRLPYQGKRAQSTLIFTHRLRENN